METYTLMQALGRRCKDCDLVLAKAVDKYQQTVTADVGRIYSFKSVFRDRKLAANTKRISFVGGGRAFGETPNYVGEVGFLFLYRSPLGDSTFQDAWHGHIPIERYHDGRWCRLYHVKLWELTEVPPYLLEHSRPDMLLLKSDGHPAHTLVRLDALERYFMNLIADIDQMPCEPVDVADFGAWIELV